MLVQKHLLAIPGSRVRAQPPRRSAWNEEFPGCEDYVASYDKLDVNREIADYGSSFAPAFGAFPRWRAWIIPPDSPPGRVNSLPRARSTPRPASLAGFPTRVLARLCHKTPSAL